MDKLTVRPVASVGGRIQGAPVERILHDAAQVPHLGHDLCLTGAVVGVRLRQDRNPLAVRQESVWCKRDTCFQMQFSGQSYQQFMLVNYNSRVILTRKLIILPLQSRNLQA